MKELTYEDWIKNPTPRTMWVWDSSENNKKQRKVIYFLGPKLTFPVVALSEEEISTENFKHCAEITEPRLMTHRELSRWLSEKPFREFRYGNSAHYSIYSCHAYTESEASKEVDKNIVIRENDGPWFIPYKEME